MDKTEKYKMSREYLQECIAACDRGIAKFSRAKNYVKAQELMRKKKEIEKMLNMTDNVEEAYKVLSSNKTLNSFLAKTMGLTISLADLALFYSDTANSFFEKHSLFQSVEKKAELAKIQEGLKAFRNFYSDLTEKQMQIQNYNLFDSLESAITKGMFEDREMIYYNEHSK